MEQVTKNHKYHNKISKSAFIQSGYDDPEHLPWVLNVFTCSLVDVFNFISGRSPVSGQACFSSG